MLKDRRLLLEHEIKKIRQEAANMYLSIVVSGGDANSNDYQELRKTISSLEFDLEIVNQLIDKGQE